MIKADGKVFIMEVNGSGIVILANTCECDLSGQLLCRSLVAN